MGATRLEPAQGNAFAVVWVAAAAIDKRWVEPVHLKLDIANAEAFSYSRVAVSVCIHIEPIRLQNSC